MKMKWCYTLSLAVAALVGFSSCDKDDDDKVTYYEMNDQMGRPGINTVFVDAADKDAFNTTIPTSMGGAFAAKFKTKLLALNPGYTTNLLTQNALLTGRALADDVIDVSLILIFGGPNATSNPTLTSDHVDGNDKPFLMAFPYMAAPH
jgi:hypothetical protein